VCVNPDLVSQIKYDNVRNSKRYTHIYVNDCEMEFLNNCCQPVELKELSLFLLMIW